ncbi:HNH endonuclease family protein [Spirosoma pulveris]
MIRIAKSTNVPALLASDGVTEKAENCRLYSTDSASYDSGATKFTIKSTIYGDESVKQQLISEQHGKCCFCEADFTANGYGDVEHFRPKAGFTKTRDEKLVRPGYYWLAYDWDNLFFSCQICNQRFKKNYFPLSDETKRAMNHTFNYLDESPLLIHPSVDNPEDHITFNRHVPVAKNKRGELSIAGFGIERDTLNRVREAYLQNVKLNIAFAGVDLNMITDLEREQYSHIMQQPWPVLEDLILKAKEFVRVAADSTKPFAAMVRANFPDLI